MLVSFSSLGVYLSRTIYELTLFFLIQRSAIVVSNNLNFLILNEQCSDSFRQKSSVILNLTWGFSDMIMSLLCYYVTNWRHFYLFFIAIPALLLNILNYYYVQESALFYYEKNQYEKCSRVLNRLAFMN